MPTPPPPAPPLAAVVLAAGAGTRMRSSLPKPLHPLCGRPMVLHILHALADAGIDRSVVVVGHGADRVVAAVRNDERVGAAVVFAEQTAQRGTGDAARVGLDALSGTEDAPGDVLDVVVVPGDTPLLRGDTIARLVEVHRDGRAAATLLTARIDPPTGYGRVVRSSAGAVTAIVEEADATPAQRAITEVGTSIYCFGREPLAVALANLRPDNAGGEYYLTDVVGGLCASGAVVAALEAPDAVEAMGVNDRDQLALATAHLGARVNERWLAAGVTLDDPTAIHIDVGVEIAPGATLLTGTVLEGRTIVRAAARLGPGTHLVDCQVGEAAVVTETVAVGAVIGAHAQVGPFASLAAGASVAGEVRRRPFYTAERGHRA